MVAQPMDLASQRPGQDSGSGFSAAGFLHPGRSAQILVGGKPAGLLGELHPALVQKHDLPAAPVVFELLLAPLTNLPLPQISDVSRFPPVTRDLAVVVPHDTPAGGLIAILKKRKSQSKQWAWIQEIKCFDEYRGKGLSEKEKSLAFRFILQSPEVTLQDAEVDALMAEILGLLQKEFTARLRS
jgi:phenylalanyl-tRNA synthetase beta chain